MKYLSLALVATIFISSCQLAVEAQKDQADLSLLVAYMQGAYSSEEQSLNDTNYLHITLDMRQIWEESMDGAWLYVEQTAAWTPGQPYRQRVYHLQQLDDSTFSSSIMTIPDPKRFIGGHLNPEIFKSLSVDSLVILPGCDLILTYKDRIFAGSTQEGACANSWGEAIYATSIVEIHDDYLYSWDQGWNAHKEQVWGAENGGYMFVKTEPESR